MSEDDDKTLWCGNLSEQVTEELLYELFLQAGPLEKVRIPKDRLGRQKSFAFITFCHEVSVAYSISLFRGTALCNRTLTLQARGRLGPLPPPIRCYGVEQPIDFQSQNVIQDFADMTEKIKDDSYRPVHQSIHRQDSDKLVMASLQGNWSHRHHPYRSKNNPNVREDHRHRDYDEYKSYSKHSSNWRDRRKPRNYRRE